MGKPYTGSNPVPSVNLHPGRKMKPILRVLCWILFIQLTFTLIVSIRVAIYILDWFDRNTDMKLSKRLLSQLPTDTQVVLYYLDTEVLPALRVIGNDIGKQAGHNRKLQQRLMGVVEIIAESNPDRAADLLETIQRQEYQGATDIINSIFNGYVNLGNMVVGGMAVGFEGEAKVIEARREPGQGWDPDDDPPANVVRFPRSA